MFEDSKTRTVIKTILWRIIGVLNSFIILQYINLSDNFSNALIMNVTGFILYFLFERITNKISYGKIEKK